MTNQQSPLKHLIRITAATVALAIPALAPALGILVPRQPEFSAIQLGTAEVKVEIKQNHASTRVMQEFFNPNSRQLEADFYFPVPRGANVTDFVLYMNGKPVKGEVLERKRLARFTKASCAACRIRV